MGGRVQLLLTVACRLAVSLGTVLLFAKILPPGQFGLIATTMTVSFIATLIADYGFVNRALTEIGARPENASVIMTDSIRAKALLSVPITLVMLLFSTAISMEPQERLASGIIWLATFANSFADTALVAFRSLRVYHREVVVVVVSSIFHVAFLICGFIFNASLIEISTIYLFTRLFYSVLAFKNLLNVCPLPQLFYRNLDGFFDLVKRSSPFALDSIATNVLSQLDAMIVAALLGLHPAGIYQAGSRLVQGMLPFAAMLASYHIPQLARKRITEPAESVRRLGLKIMIEFSSLGLFGAFGFLVFGPLYVEYFLAPSYGNLNLLWPGFAAYTFLRFVVGGLGAYLIAHGMSFIRPVCTISAGVITIIGYIILIPRMGIVVVPWVASFGTMLLLFGYSIIGSKLNHHSEGQ